MARGNSAGWLVWVFILLLLGAGGWYGWQKWKRPGEKPPEYRTATVVRGDLIQAVTAAGQLNPVVNVQVGSQISGMIKKLYVDFNSSVTQGQVIAEIDAATYLAAVHQAEGDLANAKSVLELAQIEAKRFTELNEAKLVARSEYDKSMAEMRQAESQVRIREAVLEKARVDLSRCTILAPTNGIVISRSVDVGQTVAASLSAPTLFIIANDLSRMQIDAMVSEADIGGIEVGQMVNFTVDAFPNRNFRGSVIQIRNAPTTNQNVVSYDTVVAVENRDLKLKPGMTANVSVITAEREGVLKIPNAATRFRLPETGEAKPGPAASAARPNGMGSGAGMGGGRPGGRSGEGGGRGRGERVPIRTVYTLASTNSVAGAVAPKPTAKPVKTGISDGVFTEVTEGLEEGDVVIVGLNSAEAAAPAGATGASPNPFGGGGGMRRF